MTVLEIHYEAKCKHCRFFEKRYFDVQDRSRKSKVASHYCSIPEKSGRFHRLTLKSPICSPEIFKL